METITSHIGIDLDNTIICYDKSFYKVGVEHGLIPYHVGATKTEIKAYLTSLPEGQYQWETLQGLVYGKQIGQATLFGGVLSFLDTALAGKKKRVSIVSHKTVLAHHDPDQTNLRDTAISFLKENAVIAPDRLAINDVYFCKTLEEKVQKISALNCSVFVDDLAKVFQHPEFPTSCRPLLFRGQGQSFPCFPSWEHIHHEVFT